MKHDKKTSGNPSWRTGKRITLIIIYYTMNKNLLFGVVAATGMLLATSCTNDELDKVRSGNECVVSFTLEQPSISTRAYSDGLTANTLTYAVYESGETEALITSEDEVTFSNKTATVNLRLVTGKSYDILFWADAEESPYTFDAATQTVTVDYASAASNDEKRDAFFAAEKGLTVDGVINKTITLQRPFAQLNIGATDMEEAAAAGFTPKQSSVTVKNVYNSLNLLSGEVSDAAEVTYALAAIPEESETFPVADAKYLAMNYLLVGSEKELADIEFTVSDGSLSIDRSYASVPVQRNWRTNIYGKLLTDEAAFNISIDPDYEGGNEIVPCVATNADQLAAALTADAEYISVILNADIDLPISSLGQQTPGSGEYKLGGENTKSIMIDLNGKKLNLTTTYMSSIGAKNADATMTIKNGTMTSSTTDGTWNIYDLTFANCNYVINDVVFEKAIAFTNTGKTATMKNVTINEDHSYYAIWISAVGQTVTIDGLTVKSGRGIKIDEEYVNEVAKVTLNISNATFTTLLKAAILVKSKEGAEINVSNIDISKVVADKNFAVWVDEDSKDYADKVIVNGALVKTEGSNDVIAVNSSEELAKATIEDNATIYLGVGTYIIPDQAKEKTLSFIGLGKPEDTKIAPQDDGSYEGCDYSLDGATVTFENISINTNSETYTGYARCTGTYKNCIINGTYTLYGNSTFENCTFNVSGDVYNIWTWGAPEAKFDNCTFNSDGKAILLYGNANTKLTIENSIFNDKGGLTDKKAAIEIGNDYDASYELIVNNTTVNGYEINDTGINTGTTLWANKDSMGKDKLNVVVDGEDVY